MSVSAECAMAIKDIAVRAAGYGFPGLVVDGNDVLAVHEATQEAIARARRGEGPTLIECKTYRFLGHSIGDPQEYRTAEEVESWKKKDPIQRLESSLKKKRFLNDSQVKETYRSVSEEIEEAVRFAESSPMPMFEDAQASVYAD
jgi:pyruvate dehydrogenase E1 component alpha subunit